MYGTYTLLAVLLFLHCIAFMYFVTGMVQRARSYSVNAQYINEDFVSAIHRSYIVLYIYIPVLLNFIQRQTP